MGGKHPFAHWIMKVPIWARPELIAHRDMANTEKNIYMALPCELIRSREPNDQVKK